MYLHIGNNVCVRTAKIIAIFKGEVTFPDKKTITASLPEGKPVRSSILTDDAVYLSTINSRTILSRGNMGIS